MISRGSSRTRGGAVVAKLPLTLPTTRLRERPESAKRDVLGPISPATIENYNFPPDVMMGGWSAEYVTRTARSYDEGTEESGRTLRRYLRVEIPIDVPGTGSSPGIELTEIL